MRFNTASKALTLFFAAYLVSLLWSLEAAAEPKDAQHASDAPEPTSILIVNSDKILKEWSLAKVDRIGAIGDQHVARYKSLYEQREKETDSDKRKVIEAEMAKELAILEKLKTEVRKISERTHTRDNAIERKEVEEILEKYRALKGYTAVYSNKNTWGVNIPKLPKKTKGTDGTEEVIELIKKGR